MTRSFLATFYNGVCSSTSYKTKSHRRWQSWYTWSKVSWMLRTWLLPRKRRRLKRVENGYVHHPKQGPHPKKAKTGEKRDRDGRKVGSSSGRYSNYTPLNTSLDQVLMQIKDDLSLKWPKKMKGDLSKRKKSKYCHFHRDHGHDTNECYDLKQQIEVLFKQGKLKNFLGWDHKDER